MSCSFITHAHFLNMTMNIWSWQACWQEKNENVPEIVEQRICTASFLNRIWNSRAENNNKSRFGTNSYGLCTINTYSS